VSRRYSSSSQVQGFADRTSHIGFNVHLPYLDKGNTQLSKRFSLYPVAFYVFSLSIVDRAVWVFSRIGMPVSTVDLYNRSIKQQEINTSKEALLSWDRDKVLTSENNALSGEFLCYAVFEFGRESEFSISHSFKAVLTALLSCFWMIDISLDALFAHSLSNCFGESGFDAHFTQVNLNASGGKSVFSSEVTHASALKIFFSNGLRPFFGAYGVARIRAIDMLPVILFDLVCLMRLPSCELFAACFTSQSNECRVSVNASFSALFARSVKTVVSAVEKLVGIGECNKAFFALLLWEQGELLKVVYFAHSFVSPIQILSLDVQGGCNVLHIEKFSPNYTTVPLAEQLQEVAS
jgi:hypothetical protein